MSWQPVADETHTPGCCQEPNMPRAKQLKSKNRKINSEIQESMRLDEHSLLTITELEAVVQKYTII